MGSGIYCGFGLIKPTFCWFFFFARRSFFFLRQDYFCDPNLVDGGMPFLGLFGFHFRRALPFFLDRFLRKKLLLRIRVGFQRFFFFVMNFYGVFFFL